MVFQAGRCRRSVPVVAVLGAALGMSFGVVSPAVADPKGDPIEIQCDELGSLQVVVNGNGFLTPGHVVGSTQVGVPYALRTEGTFTPVGGEPEHFIDEFARPAPRNQRLDHCSLHDEVSGEFGSLVVDGEVWISYAPSH
jgi:hypothetical protein